ncbi:DUF7288 family protein [Methanoregula sp.]|uniref:DUF7288 family protein n=1 Tax=Methanoregula sp. TaxID=2052170 RepID=UPI002B55F89C|nr:hypothetical protein [Methanoregula sp.]HVP96460.1 hypothetical protein [Methanoregula sp.]
MVNDAGQLYTIEGIAAGVIMLFTVYLVLGATSVYTPGDSHISDMQLEQTGTDALRMMNIPVNGTSVSQLQEIVENGDGQTFNTTFLDYVNNKTGSSPDNLHYEALITYRNLSDTNSNATWSYPLVSNRNLTGVEHPVRVTEWVLVNNGVPGGSTYPRAVLVEVLLWRD